MLFEERANFLSLMVLYPLAISEERADFSFNDGTLSFSYISPAKKYNHTGFITLLELQDAATVSARLEGNKRLARECLFLSLLIS